MSFIPVSENILLLFCTTAITLFLRLWNLSIWNYFISAQQYSWEYMPESDPKKEFLSRNTWKKKKKQNQWKRKKIMLEVKIKIQNCANRTKISGKRFASKRKKENKKGKEDSEIKIGSSILRHRLSSISSSYW